MHSITHTDYGLRIRLSGNMSARDIDAFSDGIRDAISVWTKPFTVFVDMRDLESLEIAAQQGIMDIHAMCLKAGGMRLLNTGRISSLSETCLLCMKSKQLNMDYT